MAAVRWDVSNRALVSEFDESEFVACVAGASHRIERFLEVLRVRPVWGAGSGENRQRQLNRTR